MLNFLLLREAIVIIGSAIGAYTDARTGLVLNKITYPMIAAGAALNLFLPLQEMLYYFAIAACVLAICYVLYYTGKIGGGDLKLFTGIALLVPFLPGSRYPFVLIAVFVAGIAAIVALAAYYVPMYAGKGIDVKLNQSGIVSAAFLGVVLFAYFSLIISLNFLSAYAVAGLAVVSACALLFIAFEKGIRKEFFLKEVSLGKMDEDEVVAWDFLDARMKKKLGLGVKRVLERKDFERLKKIGIRRLLVYRNLPRFAPFVFIGVLVVVLWPDLLQGFLLI